jgi:ribosomal protein S18 acetylase RimI-like enzyme
MIREVARQGDLQGFVAISSRATIGIAYYVVEADRCSIGDIFVSRAGRGMGVDRQLAAAVLKALESTSKLKRIESQCVSMDAEAASEVFCNNGFTCLERCYMMLELKSGSRPAEAPVGSRNRYGHPSDIVTRSWAEDDFSSADGIIHRSYRGQIDSLINSQYQSEDGCSELLSILTDSIWCGSFMSGASRVAIDRSAGKMVGVLIASRMSASTGHISQISVLPAYQGLGIGRRLICQAVSEFDRRNITTVSLAVTSANTPALHLYESCGFRTVHRFPVFYRERG